MSTLIHPPEANSSAHDAVMQSMLQSPLRIFRCYICVEHRLCAPLQDLSLLVEHLAKHFEFHLYECRGCDLKFVTPFIANFHIKEGKCKKEDGELSDDGGPLLHVIDLDTVDFVMFCHLQNAITKCTELMLYELNYGEEDLMNCLVFNKEPALCPVSPDPIIRRERQMQTSPPRPEPHPLPCPSHVVTPVAQATPAMVSEAPSDLVDGFSLVSDDELEPSERIELSRNGMDDDLVTMNSSPSNTVAVETPQQCPPDSSSVPSAPPSQSPPHSNPISSFNSLQVNDIFSHDVPPRTDRRQHVVMPERSYAATSTIFVEADSSSSSVTNSTQAPFFFQAPSANQSRSQPNMVPPSNEPVYPVLTPVFAPDMIYRSYALYHHDQEQNPSAEQIPVPNFADCHRCTDGGVYFPTENDSGDNMVLPRSSNSEWVGCVNSHPVDSRFRFGAEMSGHSEKTFMCKHERGNRRRHSYGITVLHAVDPHLITSTQQSTDRVRRSRGTRTARERSRKAEPSRNNSSRSRNRSRNQRIHIPENSREKPPCSSLERDPPRWRHRSASPNDFQMFPASVLDGEVVPLSRDRSKCRSRSRRRRENDGEDEHERMEKLLLNCQRGGGTQEKEKCLEKSVTSDDVMRTEQIPLQEDDEVIGIMERVKARAARSRNNGILLRFSDWKKRQLRRAQLLSLRENRQD
ncbi:hypothetical protein GCK32_004935 [Trichostrongylus colubriformis]|uniref:Uncharacterized protein n=1 Tax=Trichostrongylus colubriformis TaxID=6319 RepID=A0AAN8IJK9_TRICO